jgi:hypothetical protein
MPVVDRWTALANKLLHAGYKVSGNAGPQVIDNEDHQADIRLMAVTLIARTLSHMRGVLILARENRIVEARVLTRCILENQFWIVGFSEEPDQFRRSMIDQDKNRRGANGQALFETGGISDEAGEQVRHWLRENSDWNKKKSITPKEVAKNAQQSEAYPLYNYLSFDSHPTPASLNRFVSSANGEEITDIDLDPEPREDEITDTLGLACYGVAITLNAGCKILRSNEAENVDVLAREYLELMKEQANLPDAGL